MKKMFLIAGLILITQWAKAQNTCALAQPITVSGLYTVGVINGTDVPSPICTPNGANNNPNAAGEWFVYTPFQNYTVTVTTNISQNFPLVDTRFHVYSGSCGALTCIGGDDDSGANNSSVGTFNAVAGTPYYIAWDNKWTSAGFTFQLIEGPFVNPIPTPVTFTPQTISISGNPTCVVDMNKDHLDDVVSVTPTNIRINYQNTNGIFTTSNFTTTYADHSPSWSIAAGDYNRDGYNDLLYGDSSGLTFMRSNGLGTGYVEDTPGGNIFCQRTNFVDINNDGNLDAFSCHDINPNVYYLNNGAQSGNWMYHQSGGPGSYLLGITPTGGNYASLWTDYDNDGDVDLFISKCSGPPSELHRNDGNGIFTDISATAAVNILPITSWSSAIFDYDNDGDMDILIGSNGWVGNKFLRNNLDTTNSIEEPFTEITTGSGWDTNTSTNRDYIAYDFDNDGWVDVMGGGSKIMFNKGDGTFAPAAFPGLQMGAVGDLNNDGFLDILNYDQIYMNSGNPNKWLKIALDGVASNTNGIGARIEIYGAWGKQIREIRSGEGFGFMSTLNAHFGIGTASEIDAVIIRWPSGTVDTVLNPSSNQTLTVVEGSTLGLGQIESSFFSIYPNPTSDVINLKMPNNTQVESVQIFDLNGRNLIRANVENNTVDVKSLSSGTYILSLQDAQGKQHSQKFIKK